MDEGLTVSAAAPHGLAYAEAFHYIGPGPEPLQEYLKRHAAPT